ncbi:hypothetical protein C8R48DRAFT_776471 [Suillus tomentosus]|nr:hypothetical protein C8R48DRAFT_776471 [Suillus tomentosus]
MPNTEFSNTAMGDAAEQLMKIVQKAAKLRDGHPDHLKLAVEIGDLMSLVFKTHAAMEMLEHLDVVQQSFASAPVWARIRTDDPQIQQHPLKEKAHSITIARPAATAKTSTSISSAPVLVKVKPKPKPMLKKAVHESKELKGSGAPQHHLADSTAMQTKTSKWPKVTQESVLLKDNAPKDDITTDTECTSFAVKDMAPQAPNFELVAVAPGRNLNVLMPKPTLVNKAEHDPAQAADMLVSDDDATAVTATALPSPATSVPPITTLSPEGEAPLPAAQSAPSIQHPQMDMDDSHAGLTKVLEGMTLEVMQDSANLSARNATLQEIAGTLRTNIAQLTAENTAATEQLNALQVRITAQDVALLDLHRLQAELGQQERTTTILQDAYNAIHQCLTGPLNSSSPFTNSLYLPNPMYGGSQSMVPVSMGQMQAMEGLYFNLPSSVGNISSGSMLGGPSAGPSVSTITGSTRTRGDTKGGAPSGVGNEPGNR